MINVIFNNVNLQNDPYIVTTLDKNISLSSYTENNGLGNGVKLVTQDTRQADFSIRGVIKGTDRANLDSNIDSFLGDIYQVYATASSSNLDIDWAGGTRRYRCGVITAPKIIRDAYQINYCDFELDLLALDGFGTATTNTVRTVNNITNIVNNDSYTFLGEVAPIPEIKINLNSATSLIGLAIRNVNTNTELDIAYIFGGTEEIIIDIENFLVKVNGVNVSWEGVFPEFLAGNNTLRVTADGAGINYNLTYTYKARFV